MSTLRRRRGSVALLAGAIALLASACGSDRELPQNALDPQGPIARQLDNLWDPVLMVAAAVFVLVQGLVIYIMIKFRARSEDDAPVQVHGNARAELGWTIAPALILAVVGFFTVGTLFDIDRRPVGDDVVDVEVIGHQWWWEYRYPDHDVVTANELVIPAGRPVNLILTADDVMHNYWPPKLAGKVYAIPGRTNYMTIEADNPGTYYGQCAEYCGESHANMRLRVVAYDEADFEAWVESNKRGQPELLRATDQPPAAEDGGRLSDDQLAQVGYSLFNGTAGCAGCHAVNGTPAQGNLGPNLTHLYQRETFAGSMFELNERNLRLWLRDPQARKPGNKMVIRDLSESEITALIAYLETLK